MRVLQTTFWAKSTGAGTCTPEYFKKKKKTPKSPTEMSEKMGFLNC